MEAEDRGELSTGGNSAAGSPVLGRGMGCGDVSESRTAPLLQGAALITAALTGPQSKTIRKESDRPEFEPSLTP